MVYPIRHYSPAWSPQSLIAYFDVGIVCVRANGTYNIDTTKAGIWIFNASTHDRSRFLANGDTPAWSPSGDTLAIASGSSVKMYSLVGGLIGSIPASGTVLGPAWSHDGQFIAWDQSLQSPGVWLANVDSLAVRKVSNTGGFPTWQHTARTLVYVVTNGSTTSFLRYSPDDGTTQQLFSLPQLVRQPRYSLDDSYIVFSGFDPQTSRWQLFRVPATGGGPIRLTTGGGTEPTWGPDPLTIAYVREDYSSADPALNTVWSYFLPTTVASQLISSWPEQCP
jgi:Tol biopolymer transport system component